MLLNNSSEFVPSGKLTKVNEPTDKEFNLFRNLVLNDLGMEWGDDKKYPLYARVQRIHQAHQLETFQSYYDYIEKEENMNERQLLYNAVTTTKSGFYRENQHFYKSSRSC
jgi:chemotaxis methyl-accepting protein methylase